MNQDQLKIYTTIKNLRSKSDKNIFEIKKDDIFYQTLKLFPPYLLPKNTLKSLYKVSFEVKSESLIISNVGANLISKTPKSDKLYPLHHIGLLIIKPSHPVETIDVGITGNIIDSKKIIVRAESACSPSFLMGSQRCNCYEQWLMIHELAASFNPLPKKIIDSTNPEKEIKNYFQIKNGIPSAKSDRQGFIMIHMTSQNGMGSGSNQNIFRTDTTETAHLRHRGEYSAEQVFNTSMKGGFEKIGITPDPRILNNNFGYQIPAIILKYLKITKPIILLSNNPKKIDEIRKFGFAAESIHLLGRVDEYDYQETCDRKNEFKHDIVSTKQLSFAEELKKLRHEIRKYIN